MEEKIKNNYKNLKTFVNQKNSWNKIFIENEKTKDWGLEIIEFPLSQSNVDYIIQCIESELSPENLYMDGEASRNHVRNTLNYFNAVKEELNTYCTENNIKTRELII